LVVVVVALVVAAVVVELDAVAFDLVVDEFPAFNVYR